MGKKGNKEGMDKGGKMIEGVLEEREGKAKKEKIKKGKEGK